MARLRVKVVPRSAAAQVVGMDAAGVLKVKVRAAPEKGAANQEAQQLLSRFFGCAPSRCQIVHGAGQRLRLVEFPGLAPNALQEKLKCMT